MAKTEIEVGTLDSLMQYGKHIKFTEGGGSYGALPAMPVKENTTYTEDGAAVHWWVPVVNGMIEFRLFESRVLAEAAALEWSKQPAGPDFPVAADSRPGR